MTEDIAQAVAIELGHILKPGWTFVEEADRFVIAPPNSVTSDAGKMQILLEEAWRIARFVSYTNHSSISRSADGSFQIDSHMESGNGFKVFIKAI